MGIKLKGITWAHTRGYVPMVATAQRFNELNPEIEIEWEKRSLRDFENAPVEQLAEKYDLLIIDHPWAGFASKNGVLIPLEKYLSKDFLDDQLKNSVGQSHLSYNFDGFQSALAVDAACPVCVYRPKYFADKNLPKDWNELLELAKTGIVIFAGQPIYLLMDFYMLCSTLSDNLFKTDKVIDDDTGILVLEKMRELAGYCTKEIFSWNTIKVNEILSSESDYYYCPYVYGFSNYSRAGYARHILKAGDIIQYEGRQMSAVLGGTGLAVSSKCRNIDAAIKYVEFTASKEIQKTLLFDNGGQPGHREAWLDNEVNRRSLNFFKDTLKTLDNSYLRPRYDGYLYFQDNAGEIVRDFIKDGGNVKATLDKINSLYKKSRSK